ncbi:MAG: S8 family serine peptidase [Anaerolineae bacterium]
MHRSQLFRTAAWIACLMLACLIIPGTTLSHADLAIRNTQPFDYAQDRYAIRNTQWSSSPKITPRLLAELGAKDEVDVLVFVRGRPDLTPARVLSTKKAKGRFVVDALRSTAERTQAGLRRLLDARGTDYQAFWIVNMLRVQGDRALISELAGRPEVKSLGVNLSISGLEPGREVRLLPRLMESTVEPWGIASIGAPLVWGRGIRGQGIVVAGADTGVDWDHEALVEQYRGWSGGGADHNYNWHDAIHDNDSHTPDGNSCGFDSLEPCDDNGHGTHTIGTATGGGTREIGVAPRARWIACRNMEAGFGTPASYVECFQFFLAPTAFDGRDPQPDLAPHVINNSWVCPEIEGCDPSDPLWQDTIRPAVEALAEAGIAVVVSAGNRGHLGCESVLAPPAIYSQSLSIGAAEQGNRIAGFSSRGPVTVDGSNLLAPDLVAPGVGVSSSMPNDGYASLSGTSMAAPHVAGTIALMWSAQPLLIGHLAVTEQVLRASATPVADDTCGGDPDGQPNNVYGWGVINADAAVRAAETLRELRGTVTDAVGNPLSGADVKVVDMTWGVEISLQTALDGRYTSSLLPGSYRVVADTPAHFAASAVVTVPVDGAGTQNLALLTCVDWNGDGRTGVFEMQEVAGDWQNEHFDPKHDVNGDGELNVIDVAILTAHFDEPCSGVTFYGSGSRPNGSNGSGTLRGEPARVSSSNS